MLVALGGEAVYYGRIKVRSDISRSRDEALHNFWIAQTDGNHGAVSDYRFITQGST